MPSHPWSVSTEFKFLKVIDNLVTVYVNGGKLRWDPHTATIWDSYAKVSGYLTIPFSSLLKFLPPEMQDNPNPSDLYNIFTVSDSWGHLIVKKGLLRNMDKAREIAEAEAQKNGYVINDLDIASGLDSVYVNGPLHIPQDRLFSLTVTAYYEVKKMPNKEASVSDTLLRKNLIRLAHENPEIRPKLTPLLRMKQAANPTITHRTISALMDTAHGLLSLANALDSEAFLSPSTLQKGQAELKALTKSFELLRAHLNADYR